MSNVFTGPSSILAKLIGYSGKTSLYNDKSAATKQDDLPVMSETGFKGGFFEIFIPPVEKLQLKKTDNGFEANYPAMQNFDHALISNLRQCAAFLRNDFIMQQTINWIRKTEHLNKFKSDEQIMLLLHLADADAIDEDLEMLDIFYALGVRSMGITWSRQNKFGYGTPYKLPGHPNVGTGLTSLGISLVKKCDALGVLIDNAHLNEAGFRCVAEATTKPLVISHGTAHALNPSSRTFTDGMLKMIADSNGIVGISLEGVKETTAGYVNDMFRHIDYVVEKVGDAYMGFGSDMIINNSNDTIKTLLPDVINLMASKGYSQSTINKIAYENWERVLRESIN